MRTRIILAFLGTFAPAIAADPPAKLDQFGDPLPPGATQRLGTIRHRVVGESFAFAPDGKSIVCVGWGRYVSIIDPKTGFVRETRKLPVENARAANVFPDARRALVIRQPRHEDDKGAWEIWDLEEKKLLRAVALTDIKVGHFGWEPCISPDGKTVAVEISGHNSFDLRLIDVSSGKAHELDHKLWLRRGSYTHLGPRFTQDGRHLIVGGWTEKKCELQCWDVFERKRLWSKELPWPDSPELHTTLDGRILLYSESRAITLAVANGKAEDVTLPGDVQSQRSAHFESDGIAVFMRVKDEVARLHVWDMEKAKLKSPAEGWDIGERMWPRAYSRDGKFMLASDRRFHDSSCGQIRLIDLANGRPAWADNFDLGHVKPIGYLRFTADGRRLISSADDATVRAWDTATGKSIGHWACARSTVFKEWTGLNGSRGGPCDASAVDITSDGRRLVFAEGATKTTPVRLRIVDLDTSRTIATGDLPGANAGETFAEFVGAMSFDPKGESVTLPFGDYNSGQKDGPTQSLVRFTIDTRRWSEIGSCYPAPLARSAVGRDGLTIFSYGKKINLANGTTVLELDGAGSGPLALTADNKLIAGVGKLSAKSEQEDREKGISDLRVWDARTGQLVATLQWTPPIPSAKGAAPDELRWAWPQRIALHPSGRLLATSDLLGVRLWDLETGKCTYTCEVGLQPPLHLDAGSPATALGFTPDGTRLVTGMHDGTILFWPVPVSSPKPLKKNESDALWTELVGTDASKGWRAAWRLCEDPESAARLIRSKVKPVENIPPEDVARWRADTDAADFRKREAATKRLENAIDQVHPYVVKAINVSGVSPELRERLQKVLEKFPSETRPLPPWAAGISRIAAVLENTNNKEARRILHELASGEYGAWLTQEAKESLERLKHRTPARD